ncbi:protein SRC2-like [Lycium ferocissimum]|uniref:protein SRC2-like n=1 Tax=Lycium ferocissimum TaxID=112874 RepID=UPI002815A5B0|nr:protein SRC2-like [Lycium ferocissimum]
MELRPLDIKIISAENIKNINTFSKMDVYAEVSIPSYYTIAAHKQKTFIDKNSGTNPKWNHSMKFTLDESSLTKPRLYLIIRLKSERTLGDREIGEVSVPVNDLFNQSTSDGTTERFVEYPVITESGKPKGTLKFSYKFGEKFTAPERKKDVYHEPVTAYPAPMHGNSYPGVAYNEQNSGYGYPPAHQAGYPPAGYPPQAGAPGYGYPPQQPGYGYPPVQPAYGYPPAQPPKRNNNFGGIGMLNGLLIGDMVLDVGEICLW